MNSIEESERLAPEELQLARDRLANNTYIRKYLKKWVHPGFASSILGQNILLDLLSDDGSDQTVRKLEETLKEGEAYCQNFRDIFKGNPSDNADVTNSQILDTLAEVEGCSWLRRHGFEELRKLKQTALKSLDFAAERLGVNYAVEVTRLGIPQSDRKIVRPLENKGYFQFYGGNEALPNIQQSLQVAVNTKRHQLQEFLINQTDNIETIIIISTGLGILLARKYIRQEANVLPSTYGTDLQNVWKTLDQEAHEFPSAIVLLSGSNQYIQPAEFLVQGQA